MINYKKIFIDNVEILNDLPFKYLAPSTRKFENSFPNLKKLM